MVVVSQPGNKQCTVEQPGSLDKELNEFWVGNAWRIHMENNLSSFERNRTYVNAQGNGFLEVTFGSGADTDSDSRSVIALDLVEPGRMDLVLRQTGGGPVKVLRNNFPGGNYLKVSLDGIKSNRLGLGSRLVAHVGDQQIVRELYPLNSYRSQRPSDVHFGLGQAGKVDRLEIQWPSGASQTLEDLPINRHLLITEGQSEYRDYAGSKPTPK